MIPVVYATNNNYAAYTDVSIQSLVRNCNADCELDIYVFHTDLSKESIRGLQKVSSRYRVTCLDISSWVEKYRANLYSHTYFSKEMYYRILIGDVLPQYDKVVYLDGDTVVLGDIQALYDIDIGDCYIGACRNLMHAKMQNYIRQSLQLDPNSYVNSGVLLINSRLFRADNVPARIFGEITRHDTLAYPDQDLINFVCQGRIFYLPLYWNYLWHMERLNKTKNKELHMLETDLAEFAEAGKSVRLLHFTGDKKPWFFNAIPKAELFWKYAQYSSFFNQITNNFIKANGKLKKCKFEMLKVCEGSIFFTVSISELTSKTNDVFEVICNGDRIKPKFLYKISISVNGVLVYKFIYRFEFKRKYIQDTGARLYIVKNGTSVLFEYGKFFPLNGCSKSYFVYNHRFLMRREGKALYFVPNSFWKRVKAELAYDKQLLSSKGKSQRKSVLGRWLYFLTRPFVSKNIWLFSDRPSVAGDNGEALFEYVCRECKQDSIRPYFVIRKDCSDYKRLKSVGKVVAMRSIKHKFLMLHARGTAVSQTDFPLYFVFQENYVKDILYKLQRVFLQHGITKDDISQLYSKFGHNFHLFVTAARPEYASIVNNNNYGCDASIVKLTGFPRHDKLHNEQEKMILISPTWRSSLVNARSGKLADGFVESDYFRFYHDLLSNKALHKSARTLGYRLVFVPHDIMEQSIPLFQDIKGIEILGRNDRVYSDLFSRGALLVTDYSSNGFEFALLRKPIIYCHFDADQFFNAHTYQKGYFDYKRDGFGEVVTKVDEAVSLLVGYMKTNCRMKKKYLERANRFYAYGNEGNCRRVYQEMRKLK